MAKLALHKFNHDGSARRYAGNTLLCHLDRNGVAREVLREAGQALLASGLTNCLAVLPEGSHHVTIVDGVTDQRRRADAWPRDVPIDAPIDLCHAHFARVLAAFDLGLDPPLRLRTLPLHAQTRREAILLEPADEAEERRLRDLRERLAVALGLRRPDHDRYEFHISLTYVYAAPTEAQDTEYSRLHRECAQSFLLRSPELQLGAPEFCLFDDMLRFRTQFFLSRQSERRQHS